MHSKANSIIQSSLSGILKTPETGNYNSFQFNTLGNPIPLFFFLWRARVKISKRLLNICDAAEKYCPPSLSEKNYPETIIDLVIFHRLHLHMDPKLAKRCYSLLKSAFVDWNEVRVSVIRDIQIGLRKSFDSLALAVFIKDFLEFVHKELRELSLENLLEENLGEIRTFLKNIKGMQSSTIDMVLMRFKEHPIMPLSPDMEKLLVKLSLAKSSETRDRKEKRFYELLGPEKSLQVHHYLLYYTDVREKMKEKVELPAELSSGRRKKTAAKKTGAKKKAGKATAGKK